MHITCIYRSLKISIPHYVRQRIINLRNSGEIHGNTGEIRQKAFHSFSLVFPDAKYIFLFRSWGNLIPLIFPVATVKLVKTPMKKSEREFTWKCEFPFLFKTFPFPPLQVTIVTVSPHFPPFSPMWGNNYILIYNYNYICYHSCN